MPYNLYMEVLEDLVPKCGLNAESKPRLGRVCTVPTLNGVVEASLEPDPCIQLY